MTPIDRNIHHRGIRVFGIYYDSPELQRLRQAGIQRVNASIGPATPHPTLETVRLVTCAVNLADAKEERIAVHATRLIRAGGSRLPDTEGGC